MIHSLCRNVSGTSGGVIVYGICTTTTGTIIYPPYDYYYSTVYGNRGREVYTIKRVKMRRPEIAEPVPPWAMSQKNKPKLKLNKIPFKGCCHLRYE